MRRIYCTFSGSMYNQTTQRIVEDAPKFGVDYVRVYDDRWLMEQPFYWLNRWIFDLKSRNEHRGFGWYSWKPFVILQEMEYQMEDHLLDYVCGEGDADDAPVPPAPIILWTDADTFPIGDLGPLYEQCRKDGGIMLFAAEGCAQGAWTKRDCMIAMSRDGACYPKAVAKHGEADFPKDQHATARFALFEAGNYRAKQFLMEWQTYCLNPLCVGLEPSVLAPEYPEYQEHRSDQSILTNLAHKYGLKLYREADAFGDGTDRDREIFGTVFQQNGLPSQRNPVAGPVIPEGVIVGSRYRNV